MKHETNAPRQRDDAGGAGNREGIGSGGFNGNSAASAPLSGALQCLDLGWHVFPLVVSHDEGKCDGGTASCKQLEFAGSWKANATDDADTVYSWDWSKFNAYGIACGPSGLLVADQDPGDTWPFNGTRVHTSGRGHHYIYEDILGLPNRQGLQPWGIDVRGEGGFIIGPGSWHPHGSYSVLEDVGPALPPPELVEALQRRCRASEEVAAGGADGRAYADLAPAEQAEVGEAVEAKLAHWSRLCREALGWPEGHHPYVTNNGDTGGWEILSRNVAWSLACIVAAPWSQYDPTELVDLFKRVVPEEMRDDQKCAGKFTDPGGLLRKVRDGDPLTFRSVAGSRSASDVFDKVPDSAGGWDRCSADGCRKTQWVHDFTAMSQYCQKHHSEMACVAGGAYLPESFWQARPEFELIRRWAKARLAPPDATLGCLLTRVLGATSPEFVLPPYVGGEGSLNFFAAIVAPSGGGKGAAENAASAALLVDGEPTAEKQVGTGEGIVHSYVRMDKSSGVAVVHTDRVVWVVPEIDTLATLVSRSGSTLAAVTRSAWSGEPIGFTNANRERSLTVPAHEYRFAMTVGVQPGRGHSLLNEDEVAGGTPQRYMWFNGTDPNPDESAEDPEERVCFTPPPAVGAGFQTITTDEVVRTDIRDARVRSVRGEADPLDGHAMFCREKLAAAMALLAGRTHINAEDWRLAGVVAEVSDKVRESIQVELAKKSKERSIAAGRSAGITEVAKVKVVDASGQAAATKAVLAKIESLTKAGKDATRTTVRNGIRKNHRDYFESAIDALVATEQIRVSQAEGRGQTSQSAEVYIPALAK